MSKDNFKVRDAYGEDVEFRGDREIVFYDSGGIKSGILEVDTTFSIGDRYVRFSGGRDVEFYESGDLKV